MAELGRRNRIGARREVEGEENLGGGGGEQNWNR